MAAALASRAESSIDFAAVDLGVEPGSDFETGEPGAPVWGGDDPAPVSVRIDRDQFFVAFRALIGAPNMIYFRPPLDSLVIDQADQGARAASDAFYATCEDVPFLNFILKPGNVWIERALVVGVFTYGLQGAVRAEMDARARQAKPVDATRVDDAEVVRVDPDQAEVADQVRPDHVDGADPS